MSQKPEVGLIILGNSGSGKSFLCNILIGGEHFEADFSATAVTTKTEHHRFELEQCIMHIYDIPGLIEANQKRIDENKREIERAFVECPNSIVLFVWSPVGGRVQNDEVIAFNALYEAYKFPECSLAFVVNNLPTSRPIDYNSKFVVALSALLESDLDEREFVFIDQIDRDKSEEMKQKLSDKARLQLLALISKHLAAFQQKKKDIEVEADRLKKMREELRKQLEEAQKDREGYEAQIKCMEEKLNAAQEEANKMIEEIRQMNERIEEQLKAKSNKKRWKVALSLGMAVSKLLLCVILI